MLRSCYTAQFCFGYAYPPADIEWYFCEPGTPFLPIISCVNSINYVDRKDRVLPPFTPGEIPGTQVYSKGNRPVWAHNPTSYCGTPNDWLGNSTPLFPPLPVDWTGRPTCCTGSQVESIEQGMSADQAVWHGTAAHVGGPSILAPQRSSTFAFNVLSNLPTEGNINPPWNVDLYNGANPPYDSITDFLLLSYPGYHSQQMYAPFVQPDPGGGNFEEIPCGPFHFQTTGPSTIGSQVAFGYVVSDALGNVLWYSRPGGGYDFYQSGSYMDVTFNVTNGFEYP